MSMIIVYLFLGLFFIGMGFLVRVASDLIAGYNTISDEKKKYFYLYVYSAFMKKGLITIGLLMIASSVVLKISHLEAYTSLVMIFLTLIGTMFIALAGQNYYNIKYGWRREIGLYLFNGITLLFVPGMLMLDFIPPKTIITEEIIQFTGNFGFKLNISDIAWIELVDTIPDNKIIYGARAGYIKKGRFSVESWGDCRLLIHSKKSPFLIITKNNGEKFIINYYKPSETENTYQQIELLITE